MKKIFLMSSLLALVMGGFSSCDDAEMNDSKVTYYATLNLEGDDMVVVEKGTAYVEPGYSAEMKGEDVTSMVQVVSDLDTDVSGLYSIQYVVTNEDGFSASAERSVVVLDPSDDMEGIYYTDAASYRNRAGALTKYGSKFMILVFRNADGSLSVDDILGGYYGQRAGNGSNYYLAGNISVADDGTVTLNESYIPGWGDSADDMIDGKWNAASKTFSWDAVYAGMDFFVTMTKYDLN